MTMAPPVIVPVDTVKESLGECTPTSVIYDTVRAPNI